jgi:hypothetical protein
VKNQRIVILVDTNNALVEINSSAIKLTHEKDKQKEAMLNLCSKIYNVLHTQKNQTREEEEWCLQIYKLLSEEK